MAFTQPEKAFCVLELSKTDSTTLDNGGVPGVTGTLGKANSHFDPTQTGPGTAPPR